MSPGEIAGPASGRGGPGPRGAGYLSGAGTRRAELARPRGGARIALQLGELATEPSPGELEALLLAVEAALGLPRASRVEASAWRLSGRWWRPLPWQSRPL